MWVYSIVYSIECFHCDDNRRCMSQIGSMSSATANDQLTISAIKIENAFYGIPVCFHVLSIASIEFDLVRGCIITCILHVVLDIKYIM